jgi:hypothetical protein
MNILYVMILHNEKLAMQLVERPAINLFARLCDYLVHASVDINFVALQLLYGLCQYESLHAMIIGYHNEKIAAKHSKHSLIKLVKVTTFVPHASLRYYSLLIWDCLCNPQRVEIPSTKSDKIYNNQNTRYLCKNEQLLDVFILVLKEEQELAIKRTDIQILREICAREQV